MGKHRAVVEGLWQQRGRCRSVFAHDVKAQQADWVEKKGIRYAAKKMGRVTMAGRRRRREDKGKRKDAIKDRKSVV